MNNVSKSVVLIRLVRAACFLSVLSSAYPGKLISQGAAINVARLARAVVTFEVTSQAGKATGSGVIVDSSGIIATAAHVLFGATSATVRLSTGEVLAVEGGLDVDSRLDMALVRVAGFSLPAATLGNSDALTVGQRLLAIGAPLGLEATVTDGILSSIRLDRGVKHLQISVPVSPGSSGGPLFTEQGAVVGLVVSGIRGGGAENLNFALPINYVRGRLALARSKTLVPLPAAAAGITLSEAPSTDPEGASASPHNRVNGDLRTDYASLDGVALRVDVVDEQGVHHSAQTTYEVRHDPDGNLTLQRLSEDRLHLAGADGHVLYSYVDRWRTDLTLGETSQIRELMERTVLSGDVSPSSVSVSIDSSRFVAVTTQGRSTGTVPPGTLTSSLLRAAIAALPDSLPAETFVWLLDLSTGETSAQRVSFGPASTRWVPVAEAGNSCVWGAKTKPHSLPVRLVAATIGTVRQEFPVLAKRPHLFVGTGTTCVRLPKAGYVAGQ